MVHCLTWLYDEGTKANADIFCVLEAKSGHIFADVLVVVVLNQEVAFDAERAVVDTRVRVFAHGRGVFGIEVGGGRRQRLVECEALAVERPLDVDRFGRLKEHVDLQKAGVVGDARIVDDHRALGIGAQESLVGKEERIGGRRGAQRAAARAELELALHKRAVHTHRVEHQRLGEVRLLVEVDETPRTVRLVGHYLKLVLLRIKENKRK